MNVALLEEYKGNGGGLLNIIIMSEANTCTSQRNRIL